MGLSEGKLDWKENDRQRRIIFFIHFIGRVHTEKHFTHRHTTLLDADTTIRQIYLTFCFSFSVLTGQNLFPPPFVEDILRSLVR